ncbi:glucose-1-phosphate adenylyltransferase [candidate division WOR-3 bacterium]|nr:glucose-1-phosphate adenylyltransferase [candidate division WOR-3 bacterium]
MPKSQVVAVIMGGGQGTRLFPLTLVRSKPAVPFGGKYRLVDIPVSNCLNSRFNKIFVLTQFNSESLNRHINETYQFDSFSRGFVSLLAAEQTPEKSDWFQGTADAVRQCLRHIRVQRPNYVLILSGDQLYNMDFRNLLDFHISNEAELTISTIPVEKDKAGSFGIMKLGEDSKITEFQEKPGADKLENLKSFEKNGKNYLASMGIYLFNYDLLEKILLESDFNDFGKHLIPHAIENFKVFGYVFDGFWDDIGTIDSYFKANIALTDILPPFSLYDEINHPVYYMRRYIPPAKVRSSRIDESIIADGAIIEGATIIKTLIGIRSYIKKDTTLINTVAFGNDYYQVETGKELLSIGNSCHIERAIIDKNAIIGNHVVIRDHKNEDDYKGDLFWIRDGITVVKKGAIIPSHTVI